MGFQNEFASYEPLRRMRDSQAVKELESRIRIQTFNKSDIVKNRFISANELIGSDTSIDYVVAIDGSNIAVNPEKGYPGAEIGYLTVTAVLLDMGKIRKVAEERFPDPVELREAESTSSFEGVFPGCNTLIDNECDDKASLRRVLFETLQKHNLFSDGETLLETYEYLLQFRMQNLGSLPKSPISGFEDKEMTYGIGVYQCQHSGCDLFSTDAMRLHELLNPIGSSGEMYNQIMSVIEKLMLVNILRNFERKNWLIELQNIAFVMDGPLAVFSVASWLAGAISKEIDRINEKQKKITGLDMMILGIEKSGLFAAHFEQLDSIVNQDHLEELDIKPYSIMLLDDVYIKANIKPSISPKPYGEDTYFGRKIFYKTKLGHRIVPVLCCFNDEQRNLKTANTNQFARLKDITHLLDELSSNRYENSISALISAHAEAAIPLNIGTKVFEEIAKKIPKRAS